MMFRFNIILLRRSEICAKILSTRTYSVTPENAEKIKKFKEAQHLRNAEDAGRKAYKVIKHEFSRMKKLEFGAPKEKVRHHSDYVVIGGGMVGSAIAYAMKNRAPESFDLMVVERDPKYTRSSSTLSIGGIRQQFSLSENIELSLYSAEFLRNVKQHLSVLDDDPPDIQFQPHGYLFLATESGVEQMLQNHKLQTEKGAKINLLRPTQLKQQFPWLNVDGIELGSYGYENEGWFDPWALLSAFKRKAMSLGADYVNGEVIGFEFQNMSRERGPEAVQRLQANHMYIKDEVGDVHCVEFSVLIIAAGAFSAEVARLLQVGEGPGLLTTPLPVEPRKRNVYVLNCQEGPSIDMPLVVDPSGTYVRREGFGGKYVCGRSPSPAEEPDVSNLEVDYNFFENSVWPSLAKRIPCFENSKVSSAWAGYYDYNTFDQNAILGPHPYLSNVYFATGFSGHGLQMSPGIGRALMELMLDGNYVTIDLSRLHMDRVFCDKPLLEQHII